MKTPFLSVSPTNGFVDHWIPSKIRPTCPVFWASEHCKTGHKTGFVFAKLKNFSNIIHFAKFFFHKRHDFFYLYEVQSNTTCSSSQHITLFWPLQHGVLKTFANSSNSINVQGGKSFFQRSTLRTLPSASRTMLMASF